MYICIYLHSHALIVYVLTHKYKNADLSFMFKVMHSIVYTNLCNAIGYTMHGGVATREHRYK